MRIISNTEVAVLGLICENSMYGYEIEKAIEERNMRYWTEISMPSIYKVLKKLEEKDLITSELRLSKKGISQRIYTVTENGRQTLKNSVIDILSNVEKMIWRVDLGIANICVLSKEEIRASLRKYIESIDERMELYRKLLNFFKENDYPSSDHALATRPMLHLEAEKEWAIKFKDL